MDFILNTKKSNHTQWIEIIIIGVLFSDDSKKLITNNYSLYHNKLQQLIDIFNNKNKCELYAKYIYNELIIIKLLNMNNHDEFIQLMKIKKNFNMNIRYIIYIYNLFLINTLNIYIINNKYYLQLNNYFKFIVNNYKGTIEISQIYNTKSYEFNSNYHLLIIHDNFSINETDIFNNIITYNKINDYNGFDEYKDELIFNNNLYNISYIIFQNNSNNYIILFKYNNINYMFDYANSIIQKYEWNTRIIMYKYTRKLLIYSRS